MQKYGPVTTTALNLHAKLYQIPLHNQASDQAKVCHDSLPMHTLNFPFLGKQKAKTVHIQVFP